MSNPNPSEPHPFLSSPPDVFSKGLFDHQDVPHLVAHTLRTERIDEITAITQPNVPFNFGSRLFLGDHRHVRHLVKEMVFSALNRHVEKGSDTIFLFYWHTDGLHPYTSERVMNDGNHYIFGHDLHVLMELGNSIDYKRDCYLRLYLPDDSFSSWKRRSFYHRHDLIPGGFLFLCGDGVNHTPGFEHIVAAHDMYVAQSVQEWLDTTLLPVQARSRRRLEEWILDNA
ncbi:hypothetical protein FRC03_000766 [Tulasnella sp. 419]|nr:hypothetical protein FRC03_000766 [Tulasnella sp. 419]